MRTFPLKTILIGAAIIILVVALLGWRAGCAQARRAGSEAAAARTVGEQLDTVSTKTDEVRADQKEKQDAVDRIEGADQRLPDGFGADLERVRRNGSERRNP